MKHDATKLIAGVLQGFAVPVAPRNSPTPKLGQIAMQAGVLVVGRAIDGSPTWMPIIDLRDLLYPFDTHTFTNASKTGNLGPTLAQCRTAYAGKPFINDTSLFNVTATGIQEWTVPGTGYYRIRARGAGPGYFPGSATDTRVDVDGTFRLQKGDKLRILVGQLGGMPFQLGSCPSGSGGTFVESGEQGLLVVSGGAGGRVTNTDVVGVTTRAAGPSTQLSLPSIPSKVAVGEAGANISQTTGNVSSNGSGGAAYDHQNASPTTSALSFKNGGRGATNSDRASHVGGFGGGGAGGTNYNTSYSAFCSGGGGGYTGGDASRGTTSNHRGGDGGCFIADFAEEPQFHTDDPVSVSRHGRVIIDLVG